ncbi:hypothetical protein SLEP1_g7697 [Rubroshorea leprosula]|uniref:Reverse transcriptase domain-containing protein n=1 Tax=Rubroshorea leprosula TaxID=152421 RepID=A0AAV5I940_9ROSI|nr:hypothetical protein SLEP1_g7697 [Rubroshorea leprosula]
MYKILAKPLANRLRKVIEKVIGEQQMAFIRGRQLAEGVVIANEVIDEAKRNKKKSFIFKVDFEKAYDKVCWGFIDYMMTRMGFCGIWRGWIQECLRSSSVSVIVNAEGLNGMMAAAIEKKMYKGVKVGNGDLMVSHLQFADDTMLHCKGKDLPVKYLGIPIGGSHRRIAMWKPLVESVKKKLAPWKGHHLSFGGRITLINSMLSSLPVFLMSVYLLPKGKEKECYQMGDEENGTWKWYLGWRRDLFNWEREEAKELQKKIEGKQIHKDIPDTWKWEHSKEGNYSTKTAYRLLANEQNGRETTSIYKRVWNPIIPSKISAFNWQLLQDRIPTKSNLQRKGIISGLGDRKCALCEGEVEDSSHLFLKCRVAKWLWKACGKWWGISVNLENNCWKSFEQFGVQAKEACVKEAWDCIWNVVVWSVWLARNQKIFRDSDVNISKLFDQIQLKSFLWIKSRKSRCLFTLSDWLFDPMSCLKVNWGRK